MAADKTRQLKAAAAARHNHATRRANDTIKRLDRTGQSITFQAVARAAGVSRSWLYRQPDLRDTITRLRALPASEPAIASVQRTSIDSLRQRLDTAQDEITRLRHENTALRDQLARALGEQRVRP
jgi:hypothetical protein